jgi:hypothetical protein
MTVSAPFFHPFPAPHFKTFQVFLLPEESELEVTDSELAKRSFC